MRTSPTCMCSQRKSFMAFSNLRRGECIGSLSKGTKDMEKELQEKLFEGFETQSLESLLPWRITWSKIVERKCTTSSASWLVKGHKNPLVSEGVAKTQRKQGINIKRGKNSDYSNHVTICILGQICGNKSLRGLSLVEKSSQEWVFKPSPIEHLTNWKDRKTQSNSRPEVFVRTLSSATWNSIKRVRSIHTIIFHYEALDPLKNATTTLVKEPHYVIMNFKL